MPVRKIRVDKNGQHYPFCKMIGGDLYMWMEPDANRFVKQENLILNGSHCVYKVIKVEESSKEV